MKRKRITVHTVPRKKEPEFVQKEEAAEYVEDQQSSSCCDTGAAPEGD